MFVACNDLGPGAKTCDTWTQDCFAAQKCAPYAYDGEGHLDSTKCVPLPADPRLPGEACQSTGDWSLGIDDCQKSSICLNGICIPMCSGTPEMPSCADGYQCVIASEQVFHACFRNCSPVLQDCPEENNCLPVPDDLTIFECVPSLPDQTGQIFDPCTYDECAPGFFCAASSWSAACDPNAEGCCLPFCELESADCEGGLICVPWYPEDILVPAPHDIGICRDPA